MIYVCISTVYSRLNELKKISWLKSYNFKYVVSCQGERDESVNYYRENLEAIFGRDVQITFLEGYGLSKNRNATIDKALIFADEGDYLYICDDDIYLNVQGLIKAEQYCSENDIDLLAGQVSTEKGLFKDYSLNQCKLNKYNSASVSSVEMFISVNFLRRTNLKFDEKFGLGTEFPSGEEFIFCTDLIKLNGKAIYSPIVFCRHPPESSGSDFFSSTNKVRGKGAMFARVYGVGMGFIYAFAFSLFKWPKYKNVINFRAFLTQILRGVLT